MSRRRTYFVLAESRLVPDWGHARRELGLPPRGAEKHPSLQAAIDAIPTYPKDGVLYIARIEERPCGSTPLGPASQITTAERYDLDGSALDEVERKLRTYHDTRAWLKSLPPTCYTLKQRSRRSRLMALQVEARTAGLPV